MQTTYIAPESLAKLLAKCSLEIHQKEGIIRKLPTMSKDRLEKLYIALENLVRAENHYIQESNRIDLKYQILAEQKYNDYNPETKED